MGKKPLIMDSNLKLVRIGNNTYEIFGPCTDKIGLCRFKIEEDIIWIDDIKLSRSSGITIDSLIQHIRILNNNKKWGYIGTLVDARYTVIHNKNNCTVVSNNIDHLIYY